MGRNLRTTTVSLTQRKRRSSYTLPRGQRKYRERAKTRSYGWRTTTRMRRTKRRRRKRNCPCLIWISTTKAVSRRRLMLAPPKLVVLRTRRRQAPHPYFRTCNVAAFKPYVFQVIQSSVSLMYVRTTVSGHNYIILYGKYIYVTK